MIKFSVLLPTRNRLEYLKQAIHSVVRQDYNHWEIIVSDNDSKEDIKGYITSLDDTRIKYFRTEKFLPVTENWNLALEKSDGDYIIMLGDDDCLLKGYFTKALDWIIAFQSPDLFYSSAFMYSYPHVMPGSPKGALIKWGNAQFLEGKEKPFLLDKKEVIDAVKATMNFKVIYNYNMQFALIHRSLVHKLQKKGKFFQSPYPDYYAMTAVLLVAKRILAVPEPLVVVGITPKSFGYYYFNNKEKEGVEFLKNLPDNDIFDRVKKFLLPGTNMNSCWLFALETIRKNYGKEFHLKPRYSKYRLLQILHKCKRFCIDQSMQTKELRGFSADLFFWEKVIYLLPFYLIAITIRNHPGREGFLYRWTINLSHPQYTMKQIEGDFNNITEVFNSL